MDKRNENCGLPYDRCYYLHRSRDSLLIFVVRINQILYFFNTISSGVLNILGAKKGSCHQTLKCAMMRFRFTS